MVKEIRIMSEKEWYASKQHFNTEMSYNEYIDITTKLTKKHQKEHDIVDKILSKF